MDWRALSVIGLLLVTGGCPGRPPTAGPKQPAQEVRAPAPAPSVDAFVSPCPSLEARHAGLLEGASRACKSKQDCTCVDHPPFLGVRVVVARTAAPELESAAAAFRAQACPPVTVSQQGKPCTPNCRHGQCVDE
jgi:hypothetical protein